MALGVGCAATVDVVVDEREDLSQYRTWDWSPRARANVDAPDGNAAALDARLARLIEQHLAANGFERTGYRADFFISYRLALRSRAAVIIQPRAAYELSSHHSSASFVIEGSERVTRVYEQIHLAIGVTEAGGRTLWRAELMQEEEDIFALKLDDAVALLFERFPRHRTRNDTDGSPQRRSICGDANSEGEPPPGRGVRGPKGDSDREPQPDSRCPESDVERHGPGPDPLERPPESGSLA
jgi:hypothetical protein